MTLSRTLPSVRLVLVCILLLALLPMLGVVGLMLTSNAHLQRQSIQTNLQIRARSLAAEIDANLEELAAELEAVAAVRSADPERAENVRAAVGRRLAENANWLAIALLDTDDQQLMLVGTPPPGSVERLAPQLGPAIGTDRLDVLSATAPDGQVVAGIAVPVWQDTIVTATALGILRPASLLPRLNRFDRDEGAMAGLIDAAGHLIATSRPPVVGKSWPDPPIRLASEAASGEAAKISINGLQSYAAAARLHVAPWFVTYAVPASVMEAPLRLSDSLIYGLALLVSIPLALVMLLGHLLAGQIRALTLAADAVAHEQALPAIRPSPLREVAAMQHALKRASEVTRERTQARERLRNAELDLQRLQRLDTVGQLAAGVAHDFGNFLFTIRGNLELIRTGTPDNQQVQQRVIPTLALAQEALELVQQLSALARRRPSVDHRINVAEVIQEIRELLRHVAGRSVQLDFNLAPRLWDCKFDPLRLQSALVNLVTNARDAMPNGGAIRIQARNLTLEPESAAALGVPSSGRYVELSVSDTGFGMSPETVAHIFEPFFTTKSLSQGSGIGLSLLHAWVTSAGGCILVNSTLNAGTTFRILLREHNAHAPTPIECDETWHPMTADCQ